MQFLPAPLFPGGGGAITLTFLFMLALKCKVVCNGPLSLNKKLEVAISPRPSFSLFYEHS